MIEEYSYSWDNFEVRIVTPINSLEEIYDMTEWCIATFGDRWATTPPGVDYQEWFFITEADATLFRLRWL